MPNGTIPSPPAGFSLDPPATGGGTAIPPPPLGFKLDPASLSKFPKIRTPGEVAEGAANAAINFFTPPDPREHPVEFALWTAANMMPLMGKVVGPLGEAGLKGATLRTGAMTAAGTGAAALGGKPLLPAAKESAEIGVAGEALSPIASKITGLGKAEGAAIGVAREQSVDTVADKALQNELGVSRSQAKKYATPTSVDAMGSKELASGKKALTEARHSAIREVGQKYEPIYGPIEQQPVEADRLQPIAGAATESQQWLYGKGAKVSPTTHKLLGKQVAMAPTGEEPVIGVTSPTIELPGGETVTPGKPSTAAPTLGNTPSQIGKTFLDTSAGPQSAVQAQTIGQLRGHLGQIIQHANSPTTSAMERRALLKASQPVIETLNNAIPDEQRPLLQEINNQYAQINSIFPWKGVKQINAAATIPELGELAFGKNNVAATAIAIPRMQEPQKQLMRRAFGAYILNESDSPTSTLSKLSQNKDTVAALYPDSPFAKIGTWRDAMLAQKRFLNGPPTLPSQKQFEEGLKETIAKSGMTPEALQAANDALAKTGGLSPGKSVPHGFGRYLLLTAPLMGMMGWGPYHHMPELIAPAAAYYAGMLGWRQVADNPALLDGYRKFIMSGWTRTGGEMFGRMILNGINNDLRGVAPQHQIFGHQEEKGEGIKSLDKSRAEAIAPTPSAASRAEKVSHEFSKGKTPDVTHDLNRGRLSMDEVRKLLKVGAKTDVTALLDHVPLSEAVDSLEVASPEERQMLRPLVEQKMRAEFSKQGGNKTLMANLAQRMKRLQTV